MNACSYSYPPRRRPSARRASTQRQHRPRQPPTSRTPLAHAKHARVATAGRRRRALFAQIPKCLCLRRTHCCASASGQTGKCQRSSHSASFGHMLSTWNQLWTRSALEAWALHWAVQLPQRSSNPPNAQSWRPSPRSPRRLHPRTFSTPHQRPPPWPRHHRRPQTQPTARPSPGGTSC